MNNLYFIGGIHGVGKGTICKEIISDFNVIHLSASEVLKWEEISSLENKKVNDFELSQNRLISNLNQITEPTKNYLLDGHFCLLNSENEPEKINKETFIELNPKAFIIVVDKIELIQKRLEKRDNKSYDIEILQKFQDLEFDYSISLSKELNIPIIKVINGNIQNLLNFLKNESIT
ncbi:ATP-binding protein [Flavobacterium undicola]|uniref:ATP-binding protein n=1 Tax=Flavobacterium undicola TaxID=1932779 RepID=UPI001377CD79|nr:ATP-binding protein [Flavobacterium undicola]MBA0884510.1 AAA family ATPase [Flavobacterium undicola]